jgi:phage gp29-like protein
VANVNDAPTGAVTITGTVTEDQTLTADTGTIADIDGLGAFSYQWARSTDGGATWNNIAGATASTYTLGDADVGNLIRVAVSYTDGQGTAESLTSANAGPVANLNDAPTGAVTITGAVTEDQVLTADTSTIADADGLGAFSYQWARSSDGGATWANIAGATASTHTLGDADVGNLIRVAVSYTDGHSTAESLTSASAGPVANVNDAPSGAVTVTGTTTEDQVLTVDTSSIADADGLGAFSYQWARSSDGGATWVNIAGATASTYTLGDADVGNLVRVSVSYTDGHGTAENLTSASAGPVANLNDAPVGVPSITGTVSEDQTLTADTSGLSDTDGLGAFSYQWLRNGVAIGGATGSTYTLGDADVGAQISVQVSYTDGQGTGEGPLTSAQTAPVANVNDAPSGAVVISGSVAEDQVLTADTSTIADADGLGAFSYQWARSTDGGATWANIAGATASTYTLGDADVGNLVRVAVSYTDGQGTAESLTSGSVGPVANVNDAPTGAVTITGTVTEDQVLTADTSTIADADGLGAFSYQWARSTDGGATWVSIAGATASGYTLGDADVNALIEVSVSYTDSHGSVETLTSGSVGPVANVNDAPVFGANSLSIAQRGSVILGVGNLSASDVDDVPASLMFSVSGLANGRFELVSAPGVAIASFTLADVAAGQVRFVHDGSGSAPAYALTVSDGVLSDGPLAASIAFSADSVVPEPIATPSPEPTVNPGPTEGGGSSGGIAVPARSGRGAASAPPVLPPGGAIEPEAEINLFTGRTSLTPVRARLPVATLNSYDAAPRIDPTLELLAALPANLEYLPSVPIDWGIQSAFPESAEQQTQRDQIEVLLDQIELGGLALSVGVVWWASRISGLLGTLLTSTPAWRHIDPLPVVGRDEEEDKKWYDPDDREADANELAVADVFAGAHTRQV